jgi:prepilin-type N-terminal cleavage/methylation domain-containing protein
MKKQFYAKMRTLTGFSLVECIVALLIFSLMMVTLFTIMAQIIREKGDVNDYSSYIDLKISAGTPGTSDGTLADGEEFKLLFLHSDGSKLMSDGSWLGISVKYTTSPDGSYGVIDGAFSDGVSAGLARVDRVDRYNISSDGMFPVDEP